MVTPAQIIKRKRALKRYVVKHGGNPRGLNFAPVAGPVYRKWIRWLQKREWPKLPPTGIADSRVLAVLFPPKPETIGHHALRIAEACEGVRESPAESNRGPVVDTFLAACGFHFRPIVPGKPVQQGEPWCACFVTWALRKAGWTQAGWNQAYVPDWVATAHKAAHGLRVIGAAQVQAGDVVCFDWGHDGVADHIGFAAGPVKNGSLPTCEGNTSAGNNSNGGQVQERTRTLSDVACFIRVT
jgi:hypothetical protein